eukprot:767501-Hanusia_phi.AAC.4
MLFPHLNPRSVFYTTTALIAGLNSSTAYHARVQVLFVQLLVDAIRSVCTLLLDMFQAQRTLLETYRALQGGNLAGLSPQGLKVLYVAVCSSEALD